MAKINSWGRTWKKQISVTFKKDEQIIEDFINEKIDPTSYIKELILKDMKLIKDTNINSSDEDSEINNTDDEVKNNEEIAIDPVAAEKLHKMFEL